MNQKIVQTNKILNVMTHKVIESTHARGKFSEVCRNEKLRNTSKVYLGSEGTNSAVCELLRTLVDLNLVEVDLQLFYL